MTTKLPDSWESAPLGDVCKTLKGKKPKNSGKPSNDRTVPYINIKAFETGIPVEFAEPGDYPECSRENVLIVWDGARSGLTGRGVSGYIGSTLSKIWSEIIDNGYLYYFLCSQYNYINTNTKGVGIPHVDPTVLFSIDVPIAPLNEQKRIVAEIEKQFSRLDEAVDNLKRVKANLKRYKASVLKAAVEGKLTEEWRKKHPDVEPADKLLQLILAERRKKWEEAELARLRERAARRQAKMKAKGKEPKDDKWKKKYKEPVKPSGQDLTQIHITDIPDSWVFCTADQLTTVVTDGEHITPTRSNKGIFLLSARNIQDGWISFEKVDYISKDVHEKLKQRLTINEGDVLMSCSGSVGRSCVAPKKPEFSLVRSVAALKPVIENGKFMSYSIRSTLLQSQINTKKTQTAQANIFQGKIRTLIFTLPPIQEQDAIIIQVEEKLSVADKFEFVVDNALKRAERLRQTILKKAFSGNLTQ